MKTLHVTIRLGVHDDDGAFDKLTTGDLWMALCRAFPLCRCDAIEVEPVNIVDLVSEAEGQFIEDFAAGKAAAESEIVASLGAIPIEHSLREGRKS